MEMLSNGILDIEDTEGEEISLTAEGPQLTEEEQLRIESEKEEGDDDDVKRIDLFASEDGEADPLNKLLMAEDGISTLFMKKGGRVKFQGGGRDASSDDFGGGSSDQGETSSDSGFGGGNTSSNNNNNNDNTGDGGWENTQSYEDFNKTERADPDALDMQDYLTDYVNVNQKNIEQKEYDDLPQAKKDMLETKKKQVYLNNLKKVREDIDKQLDVQVATKAKNFVVNAALNAIPFGQIAYQVGRFFGVVPDLKGTVPTDISGNIIGKNTVTPSELGFYQGPEYDDFWQGGPDKITDNDKTIIEEIMSSTETIQDRDETDIFDIWDKIKDKQAQRAMLVEKDIIQDNEPLPITKESVSSQLLNNGGLANLFRVKTQ
jgi:hypothetical protein